MKIQVTLTVEGDTLTADFTGTDPQVRGAINSTLSFAASVVALCVRSVMREEVPNNAGHVPAADGSSRRRARSSTCVMPAASSMRGVTGFRMVDAVFGALAGCCPTACWRPARAATRW